MAPEKPTKGKKRAGDASVHKYSKTPKKIKPELSKEEKLKKKWKSLKDQVNDGFLDTAYKTSKRSRLPLIYPVLLDRGTWLIQSAMSCCHRVVLELDPDSHNAVQTHIQILLSLDRFKDALSFITSQQSSNTEGQEQWQLEQAYALYKLGRVPEAATIIEAVRAGSMQLDEDGDYARAVDVLDAQIVSCDKVLGDCANMLMAVHSHLIEISPRGLRSGSRIIRRPDGNGGSGELCTILQYPELVR